MEYFLTYVRIFFSFEEYLQHVYSIKFRYSKIVRETCACLDAGRLVDLDGLRSLSGVRTEPDPKQNEAKRRWEHPLVAGRGAKDRGLRLPRLCGDVYGGTVRWVIRKNPLQERSLFLFFSFFFFLSFDECAPCR